jgi:hypothetical protein
MSRLTLDFQDIYTSVSEFLGTGSTPTGTNLTKCKNITYRAYRRFLYPIDARSNSPHMWSFLKKRYTIITEAAKWRYTLPSDFSRMLLEPVYGEGELYGPLMKVQPELIDNLRAVAVVDSYPVKYAISPLVVTGSMEPMWELWLWPEPQQAHNIKFTYIVEPEKPSATTDLFLGGTEAAECILEMSLAVAEQQEDDMATTHHTEIANDLLQKMIIRDIIDKPDTVGRMINQPQVYYQRGYEKLVDADVYAADAK